jgi:RHS repeat-associated protein
MKKLFSCLGNALFSLLLGLPLSASVWAQTITLASAANNQVLTAPATISLKASTGGTGITKVEFYQGTNLISSDSTSPYSFSWRSVGAGSYSFTAKAMNSADSVVATSEAIAIVVNAPPTVSITSPSAGQGFATGSNIVLNATVADSDGTATKVEFYRGNTLVGTDTTSPYSLTWSNAPAGSYSLTAKATDNHGATTTSAPVSVTVGASSSGVYYLHSDHLNTPRLVTDEQNTVVWRNQALAEPFGTSPPEEDPDGNGVPFTLNLRFPGQYFDQETNLSYNYFRDYDSTTGRYIQSDPIGLQGGINTYGYVGGNPMSYTDPTGQFAILLPALPAIGEALVTVGTYLVGGAAMAAILNTSGDSRSDPSKAEKPGICDVGPNDLCEQLALAEAKAGAGVPIMGSMADAPRLVAVYGPGPWIKMQHTHVCSDGRKLVIHYFSNGRGLNVELKFK